jgi:hypothetical protein
MQRATLTGSPHGDRSSLTMSIQMPSPKESSALVSTCGKLRIGSLEAPGAGLTV